MDMPTTKAATMSHEDDDPRDGPAAFPVACPTDFEFINEGMLLRDWFAAQCLAAMPLKCEGQYSHANRLNGDPEREARWVAVSCYRYADALMAAREQK